MPVGGVSVRDHQDSEMVAQGPGISGLVSVVIPTYNRGYIISQAIKSILAQSYQNIEVIVVDDGSTDDTAEVVSALSGVDRYIKQTNAGVCGARNAGLRAARGEFIALIDSDDAWLPWKLDAQVAVLKALPQAGMVWTDMIAVDEHLRQLQPAFLRTFYKAHDDVRIEDVMCQTGSLDAFWPSATAGAAKSRVFVGDIFSSMMLGNLVHTSTVLIRRDRLRKVGLFDTNLRRSGEDYEFHLRTAFHGPVAFIDASSILYRVGAEDQLTNPKFSVDIARNNLTTVQNWCKRGRQRITLPAHALRRRLARSHGWVGESELLAGNPLKAARHLAHSLLLSPSLKSARQLALCGLPYSTHDLLRRSRRAILEFLAMRKGTEAR